MRRLKPGLSAKAAALQLGLSVERAKKYGKMAGYQFIGVPAARHFYWQKRIKSLPPLLTVSAVARELGVTPGYAALLCHRHRYKVTIRNGWKPARVPIRPEKLTTETASAVVPCAAVKGFALYGFGGNRFEFARVQIT